MENNDKNNKKPFNYGGQAVMEGVMMRGSKAMAVAVRHPEGHIIIHREPLDKFMYDGWISRTPFIRGLVLLWDSLGLGVRSLLFSSNVAMEAENTQGKEKEGPTAGETAPVEVESVFEGPLAWGMLAVSFGFGIGLFFLLPAFVAGLIEKWLGIESAILGNLVEGVIRLFLLIGYIWAVGKIPDIARVFSYHGAEHKTIMAYEAKAKLEPEIVSRYSMYHPRCGTGFLLTVVVISILLFTFFGQQSLPMRLLTRLLLIPVVAGIAYEYIKFTAKYQHLGIVRAITQPNLWLQRLTTREPTLPMLEVAIKALQYVLQAEEERPAEAETLSIGV
ncbi:MAG: DUF1385 domain-containing protein [Anaerolineales bacterium]|nr:DUF1385 domain-containing protein [Anaerolineales bacterium]